MPESQNLSNGLALLGVILAVIVILFFTLKGKNKTDKDSQERKTEDSNDITSSVDHQNLSEDHAPSADKNTELKSTVPVEKEKSSVAEKETTVKEALSKTQESFFGRIKNAFRGQKENEVLEEIEEVLYTSDLGPQTVQKLMTAIDENLSRKEKHDIQAVHSILHEQITGVFSPLYEKYQNSKKFTDRLNHPSEGPLVLMVVGVNGAGKTTSIGKISALLANEGHKVLVAAGDTFRAAAGGQLRVWTERAQVEIFSPEGVTDPSAVAFDAISKGKAQKYDYVIIDTAGRLHTQANLMEELKKMKRVMTKVIPDAPHEILIILDANSGQNALIQAKEYHQALGLTGVVLTKMDGTAKGGVAVGVAHELKIPIKYIGIGEKITDLRLFDSNEFVSSILGEV